MSDHLKQNLSGIAILIICGFMFVLYERAAPNTFNDDAQTCEQEPGDVAITACSRAIASGRYKGNDLADLYNNRCVAYLNKRESDEAIADCTEAIQLDPKFAVAYSNRGSAYYYKDDYDRAIADYTQAITLDPKYANAYNFRGGAYRAKGDLDRAIADYTQAITLENVDGYNDRCWARALQGSDLQGALADCNQSLALRPNDADTLNSRGFVYLKFGNFDAAIADYSAAIAQNAKDADSLYGRGMAKLKKGDAAGGNVDIAAAKAITPDIDKTYAGYGVT